MKSLTTPQTLRTRWGGWPSLWRTSWAWSTPRSGLMLRLSNSSSLSRARCQTSSRSGSGTSLSTTTTFPAVTRGAPGEDQTARQTRQVDVHPHSQEAGGRRDRGDQDQRIPTHLRPAVVPGNSIICPSENCCITLSAGGQRSKCLDREDPAMLRLSFLPISERCLRVGVFSGQSWKL